MGKLSYLQPSLSHMNNIRHSIKWRTNNIQYLHTKNYVTKTTKQIKIHTSISEVEAGPPFGGATARNPTCVNNNSRHKNNKTNKNTKCTSMSEVEAGPSSGGATVRNPTTA
mmetsp:Transcript_56291/g.67471  ORF Transcript_56291/g.67471 Transcript_56291/m.67471 type:complete len:111 (+) Transcript_56291:1669-2001(+)